MSCSWTRYKDYSVNGSSCGMSITIEHDQTGSDSQTDEVEMNQRKKGQKKSTIDENRNSSIVEKVNRKRRR